MSDSLSFLKKCVNLTSVFDDEGVNLPVKKIIRSGGGIPQTLPVYKIFEEDDGSLYVVIRGSRSHVDFSIVLDMLASEFNYVSPPGYCHRGVLKASEAIFDNEKDVIMGRSGKVYCVGHSLGGAVAAVLATIINSKSKGKAEAFAFGPFPIFSSDIIEPTKNYIKTYIYCDDVVPKITVNAIRNLTALISLMSGGKSPKEAIELFVTNLVSGIAKLHNSFTEAEMKDLISNVLPRVTDLVDLMNDSRMLNTTLMVPGVIKNIRIDGSSYSLFDDYDQNATLDVFSVLNGVSQHLLQSYVESINILQ